MPQLYTTGYGREIPSDISRMIRYRGGAARGDTCLNCVHPRPAHGLGSQICGNYIDHNVPSPLYPLMRQVRTGIFVNPRYTQIPLLMNNGAWQLAVTVEEARMVDPLVIPEERWEQEICDNCQQTWTLHEGASCEAPARPATAVTPREATELEESEPREMPRSLMTTRKFGVEIELTHLNKTKFKEAMRKYSIAYEDQGGGDRSSWILKHDGSVRGDGLELVSPPLRSMEGMAELRLVLGLINACEGKVDASCGLHVHHDARNLGETHLKRLLSLYKKYERLLYLIAAPARFRSTYCRPRTMAQFNALMQSRDFNAAIRDDRYYGINFQSLDRHRTIEFRLLEGTLNEKKIEAWIILTQRLIFKAKNGGRIVYNTERGLQPVDNIDLMGRTLGLKRTETEHHSFIVLKECYNKHKNTPEGRQILRFN